MTTEAPDLLDLLTAVADNPQPLAERYRERIHAAMIAAAEMSDDRRTVNPNRVRELLSNEHGLTVPPRMLSASYGVLRSQGVLVRKGWVESTDSRGGNRGKLIHAWEFVGGAA